MKQKLCRLCLQPRSQLDDSWVEEKPSLRTGNEIRDLIYKIFSLTLNFGPLSTKDDLLCIKCDKYLEISHVMYQTVVNTQSKGLLSEENFIVVAAADGEIIAESFGLDESIYLEDEIKQEDLLEEDADVIEIVSTPKKVSPSKPKPNVIKTIEDINKTIKNFQIYRHALHKNGIPKPTAETSPKTSKEQEEDEQIRQYFVIECDQCPSLIFETFGSYKTHMKSVHGHKWAYLICCNLKLCKRKYLLEHIDYHQNPDKYKCPECGKQFSSMIKVENHQKTIHGPSEELQHECDKCGKRFLKACTLKTHMVIHLSKEERDALNMFECNECGSRFDSKYKLEKHMEQVHLNMNLFVCDICAKVYKTKSQYTYHYTHAHTDKPRPKVQCPTCLNFFLNEKGLRTHIKSVHTEKGEYVCNICGKISATMKSMRSHKRYMHQVERKFACTVCVKAFKVETSLKEHMTTHLGGTLYNCQFCDKTFNSKANMYSHRKRKHAKELERFIEEKKRQDLERITKINC